MQNLRPRLVRQDKENQIQEEQGEVLDGSSVETCRRRSGAPRGASRTEAETREDATEEQGHATGPRRPGQGPKEARRPRRSILGRHPTPPKKREDNPSPGFQRRNLPRTDPKIHRNDRNGFKKGTKNNETDQRRFTERRKEAERKIRAPPGKTL